MVSGRHCGWRGDLEDWMTLERLRDADRFKTDKRDADVDSADSSKGCHLQSIKDLNG